MLNSLSSKGHVLIISMMPPRPSASALVMRNLLAQFDPGSYSVATIPVPLYNKGTKDIKENNVHYLIPHIGFSSKLNRWGQEGLKPIALSNLIRLINKIKPVALVGVFPDEYHLYLAREAAKITQTPLLAYFHDLYAEQQTNPQNRKHAFSLQNAVFAEASSVFAVNKGMRSFYKRAYNLEFQLLVISYPDPIPAQLPTAEGKEQILWGGHIYNWTANTVKRFAQATTNLNYPLILATAQHPKSLRSLGLLDRPGISQAYFGKRGEYLNVLQQQGVLIAGLDWPDESPVVEDELATAFSTKTIEYMASGRPILINCPEHYFLAQFFKSNGCGLVITERSVEQLQAGLQFLMQDSSEVRTMRQKALETVQQFATPKLALDFSREIDAVSATKWGSKVID